MKKYTWVTIVVLAFLGAFVASTPASASEHEEQKCFEMVEEHKYQREVDTHGDVIDKQTRTITSTENGRTVWSEWTDWGAEPVNDDGRNRGPAAHNNKEPGTVGYREFRYVVVGRFVNGSETQHSGWVSEEPEGEGWVLVDTRIVEGDEIDCPQPTTTEVQPSTTTQPTNTTSPPTVPTTEVPQTVTTTTTNTAANTTVPDTIIRANFPVVVEGDCAEYDKYTLVGQEGILFLNVHPLTGELTIAEPGTFPLDENETRVIQAQADEGYDLRGPKTVSLEGSPLTSCPVVEVAEPPTVVPTPEVVTPTPVVAVPSGTMLPSTGPGLIEWTILLGEFFLLGGLLFLRWARLD